MSVEYFIKTYCDDTQRFEFHYLNSLRKDDTACCDGGKQDALELLEFEGLQDNEITCIKTISYGEEDYLVIKLANY